MAHIIDEANNVTNDGILLAMRIAVRSGITSVHNEILNVDVRCVVYSCMWVSPMPDISNPAIKKMTSEIVKDGIVVKSM